MKIKSTLLATALLFVTGVSQAVVVNWTDWQSAPDVNNVYGEILTTTATIDVHYNNPQSYAFTQLGSGIDYFRNYLGAPDSPYTSGIVDNIPTASEMIGLRYAGSQSLTFSETVANPFFSYVSLNGNGYSFDQDFDILSYGDSSDGNRCGNWGCGTSYKNIVDLGGGNFEYQLLGTGEPHGTIMFTGVFDTVSWNSLSNENWNGFTFGVQGTAVEVFPASEPSILALMTVGIFGLGLFRRKMKS